jgi:hypothetical protein
MEKKLILLEYFYGGSMKVKESESVNQLKAVAVGKLKRTKSADRKP